LWLPQDSVTVEESSVLPLVLQEAWKRSLVVFSSSVSHVKRGALFSLYPNNIELGRNLADTALGRASSGGAAVRAIMPLREVLVAVNVRTAGHLGLGIGTRQQQAFDMVFPEQ
jgi:putative ABC transport system substrate-binding protein